MSSSQAIAVTGATVLTGTELAPVPDATVVIENGSIRSIAAGGDVPAGVTGVGAGGLTLVPGFIDAHVHIGFYPPKEVLAGGVTTVRDLAWPPERIWPLVEASAGDDFDGPTILAAGQMLTVPGGYPTRAAWAPRDTGRVVADSGDVARAVEEQVAAGAAVIKVAMNSAVGPTFDRATLSAVAEAAHQHGLKVTGHIYALEDLDIALDAGLDELAHMVLSGETIDDETIARMIEQNVAIVPTLSCFHGRALRRGIDNLARFHAAGGTVVYGTDLGNEGPRPGIDEREIKALVKAGLSGREVIAAATSVAARHLGLDRAGVLASGTVADIVGVPGDPLRDPAALFHPGVVIRRGRVVPDG